MKARTALANFALDTNASRICVMPHSLQGGKHVHGCVAQARGDQDSQLDRLSYPSSC